MALPKVFSMGTHRAVLPETTLARIEPHLASFGITRCADVTGLDKIGLPVFCAIRPGAISVSVSNGKGLRPVDARVSALMEAIELHAAETPSSPHRRASPSELRSLGDTFVSPGSLPQYKSRLLLDERSRLEWVEADEILGDGRVWVPASAVYCLVHRSLYRWTSNGLASGNNRTEATLHALYEVIERHTLSGLVNGRRLDFAHTRVFDLATVQDPILEPVIGLVRKAGLQLVLLQVPSQLPVYTFMAVLCDSAPFGLQCRIDPGYGAHLNPVVAALRAVTEAAQGRLSVIHGSREDVHETTYEDTSQARLYRFFSRLTPEANWADLEPHDRPDLEEDYRTVIDALRDAGHASIIRAQLMSSMAPEISVVKVLIPGMRAEFPV